MTQVWLHIGYFVSSGKNGDELHELNMFRKRNGSDQMYINIFFLRKLFPIYTHLNECRDHRMTLLVSVNALIAIVRPCHDTHSRLSSV